MNGNHLVATIFAAHCLVDCFEDETCPVTVPSAVHTVSSVSSYW